MKTKRVIAKYTCFTCVIQTVGYSLLLSTISIQAKLLKLGIIAFQFFCLFQTQWIKRVKETDQSLQVVASGTYEEHYTKWEVVQLKLTLQKESQRQFFWYNAFFFLYLVFQISQITDYYFRIETTETVTDKELIIQNDLNYFYTGFNIATVVIVLTLLDIHWVIMGTQLTLYSMIQVFLV